MSKTGRGEANSIAGEEVVFKNDKGKLKELQAAGVEGLVSPETKCIAPAFNLVSAANAVSELMREAGRRMN